MFCTICKDPDTDMRVIDSRKYKDLNINATKRRYKCPTCGARMSTMETPIGKAERNDNK